MTRRESARDLVLIRPLVEVAVEEVVDDYDFQASVIGVAAAVAAKAAPRMARTLPIQQPTIGSYGR